jgi:hypothetical protein
MPKRSLHGEAIWRRAVPTASFQIAGSSRAMPGSSDGHAAPAATLPGPGQARYPVTYDHGTRPCPASDLDRGGMAGVAAFPIRRAATRGSRA